jgi:hypothetical protein
MSGWTSQVEAPFADDRQFWSSVGRSVDAFWTLVISTALVALFGAFAAIAFVVPVALLVVGGWDARASSARSRPLFATREEWRAAERQAVAAAIPGALIRYLRPRTGLNFEE